MIGKAVPRLSSRARHRNGPALSAWVASIITVSSATRRWRAGKMFFALHAEIIFAYLLMHFSRTTGTRRKPLARHRLTACGRGPRARPRGRTARPAGDGNALTGDLTAWRPARPAGETIPLNQEPRTKARGRRGGAIMHRNQAGGWTCSGVRGPALPMSLPPAPAPAPGSCSGPGC